MKNLSLENPLSTPICLFPLFGGNKQFAFRLCAAGGSTARTPCR